MLHNENKKQSLEDFYNALNEDQKFRVEEKLRTMLKEQQDSLPQGNVNAIRYQIASDMYQILKG